MTKMLKVKISGTYRGNDNEIMEYETSGVMPYVPEETLNYHVQNRYATKWIRAELNKEGNSKYPQCRDLPRTCYINDVEEIDGELSFVGKNIKEMTEDELQDLATAKDLRIVPAPRIISGYEMRDMRARAYKAYSEIVLGGKEINLDAEDFNFSALPPLIVSEGSTRKENVKQLSNDEILDMESKPMALGETPQNTLTMDELRQIAKDKGITFHPSISFEKLYAKIFN